MSTCLYRPWLHRVAVSTAWVAMVTVIFGALTTTKDAGMAFPRWLYSDDHLVPLYPWLQDFGRNWNKFLEHGHRLAGMLIGLWTIGLVVITHRLESRGWVRKLSLAILFGVICQGVLGGFRVELNNRGLAMVHGAFAAVVFSLMASFAVVTSQAWFAASDSQGTPVNHLKAWSVATIVALAVQYLLGGLIRHHGTGLHEHLGMGVLAYGITWINAIVVHRSQQTWLKWSAWMLVGMTTAQVLLGGGAWFFKYGFAPMGIVPIMNSVEQILMRTVHTVFGILVFMTALVHVVRVYRVTYVLRADLAPFSLVPTAETPLLGGVS